MAKGKSGKSSHPTTPGPVPNRGGQSLAVKDNANVRADRFGDSPAVRNIGPQNNAPFAAQSPPTRGRSK